jgi:uncharacterized membrane protein
MGAGPESYSVGNAVSYGWNKFKDNAGVLILLTLAVVAGIAIVQILSNVISGALLSTAETNVDPVTGEITTTSGSSGLAVLAVSLLFGALSFAVQIAIQSAVINGSLQLSRGQGISVGNAFAGINWGQVILTAILVGLGTFVGLLLCIIPGLIWIFLTSYSMYYVIDRKMPAVEAIKASIDMVRRNVGPLLLFWLATVAITILGACLCGVGLLVAIPVVILAQAYTFRTFNNDPVTA